MEETPPLLLLTRPQAASERFADELRARGIRFRPIISPARGIVTTGPLPEGPVDGVIFTSAQAVRAWSALGGARDVPAYAVGGATAQAAREAGMMAQSAEGDADALVAMLAALHPDGRLVHLRGRHVRGDVAERLCAEGLHVDEAVIYDQPELYPSDEARAALMGNAPVVAPLFSPRSALIVGSWPIEAPLLVAAMSEAVAKAASTAHIKALTVAARPDAAAMTDSTAELLGIVAGMRAETG